MRSTAVGIPVLELDDIGSTNVEAMRLGLDDAATPLWVRAERQTAGRGRSGRPWMSEPGNLYATLLLRLACLPGVVHQLSFVAAVAVVAALRRVARQAKPRLLSTPHQPRHSLPGGGAFKLTPGNQIDPIAERISPPPVGRDRGGSADAESPKADLLPGLTLKWPNDVLIGGAKLVGILPESTIVTGERLLAVIGCGINLLHAPQSLDRATTCLAAHGIHVEPAAMLDALSIEMAAALDDWNMGAGFAIIRTRWLQDATTIGTIMTVHAGRDIVSGTFGGLHADGALILRDHWGYDHRMTFGDVTLGAADSSPDKSAPDGLGQGG